MICTTFELIIILAAGAVIFGAFYIAEYYGMPFAERERRKRNKQKAHLMFKVSLFKVRHTHKRMMKVRLRILKFCLYKVVKIGIPKNNEENETLKRVIAFYDETIQDLNKDIDRCRQYVWD